ncbi:hypothetical protein BM1_06750 [Bipolaris maydis]|nr:hypothetical protein BM1_06750 [Bipolaris maydis]
MASLGQRVGQWVACKRAVPVCFVKTAQWLRKAGTAGGACWIRDDAKAQVEALGLHGMPSPWSTRTPIRADQTGLRGRDSRDLSKPLVPEDDRFVPKGPAVHNASPETPMASVFGEIPAGADLHVGIEGFSLPPVAPAKTWQGRAGQGRAGPGCKASTVSTEEDWRCVSQRRRSGGQAKGPMGRCLCQSRGGGRAGAWAGFWIE